MASSDPGLTRDVLLKALDSGLRSFQRQAKPWPNKAFHVACSLFAISELANLEDGDEVLSRLQQLLGDNPDVSEYIDDAADFIVAWSSQSLRNKGAVVKDAVRSAVSKLLKPTRCVSKNYQMAVSIIGHLQFAFPAKPIYMPRNLLAELLGVEVNTASSYIKIARQEGLISAPIQRHSYTERRAETFTFRTDAFDWESGEQILQVKAGKSDPNHQFRPQNCHAESHPKPGAAGNLIDPERQDMRYQLTLLRTHKRIPAAASLSWEEKKKVHDDKVRIALRRFGTQDGGGV